MWYVRSLPGVVRAFEVAYGEPAVAAYDRMSVNLPTSSGNPAALRVASQTFAHGKLNANGLHTHYNQDGFGDEQLICYAILNLWDMNKAGGASERLPPSLPHALLRQHLTAYRLGCFLNPNALANEQRQSCRGATSQRRSGRSTRCAQRAGRAKALTANGLAQGATPESFSKLSRQTVCSQSSSTTGE
jgi:hypothetical protein